MDKAGKIPGMKSKIDHQTSKDTGPLTKQLGGITTKADGVFNPPENAGAGFSEIIATGAKVTEMLVRGSGRIELGFTQGMKDNITALDNAMKAIGQAFEKFASMPFIVTAMNNAGGDAVKSLAATMELVFSTAKPIIDPNFCQRVTLICQLKAKIAELKAKL